MLDMRVHQPRRGQFSGCAGKAACLLPCRAIHWEGQCSAVSLPPPLQKKGIYDDNIIQYIRPHILPFICILKLESVNLEGKSHILYFKDSVNRRLLLALSKRFAFCVHTKVILNFFPASNTQVGKGRTKKSLSDTRKARADATEDPVE